MNKKGFTLVELLATIIVLAIVTGITVVSVLTSLDKAKQKTEKEFLNQLSNIIDSYMELNIDIISKSFSDTTQVGLVGTINKNHGNIKLYSSKNKYDLSSIINNLQTTSEKNLINPVNSKECTGKITYYRDEDYVYYYTVTMENDCLEYNEKEKVISTLPNYNSSMIDFSSSMPTGPGLVDPGIETGRR